jgi:hypothetical protein
LHLAITGQTEAHHRRTQMTIASSSNATTTRGPQPPQQTGRNRRAEGSGRRHTRRQPRRRCDPARAHAPVPAAPSGGRDRPRRGCPHTAQHGATPSAATPQHDRVGRRRVGHDLHGRDLGRVDGLLEAPPGGGCVPTWRAEHADDLAGLVDRAVGVAPPAGYLHVGLVHEPANPASTITSGGKRKPAKADRVAGAGRGWRGSYRQSAARTRLLPMQQCRGCRGCPGSDALQA